MATRSSWWLGYYGHVSTQITSYFFVWLRLVALFFFSDLLVGTTLSYVCVDTRSPSSGAGHADLFRRVCWVGHIVVFGDCVPGVVVLLALVGCRTEHRVDCPTSWRAPRAVGEQRRRMALTGARRRVATAGLCAGLRRSVRFEVILPRTS